MPAVNQIEVHPYFTNDEVRAYGQEHGIATEAWSPIAQGEVLDDPVVDGIADAHGQVAGPGGAALAHPARRHRVPEVGDAGADQGELRDLRLRAEPGRRRRASPRWTGARRAAADPTPTSSTTSPTDAQATLDYLVSFMQIVPLTGLVIGRYSSVRHFHSRSAPRTGLHHEDRPVDPSSRRLARNRRHHLDGCVDRVRWRGERGSIRNLNHHNDYHHVVATSAPPASRRRRRRGSIPTDRIRSRPTSRRRLRRPPYPATTSSIRTERASQRLARSLLSGANDMMWAIAALSDVCIRRGSCAVCDSR